MGEYWNHRSDRRRQHSYGNYSSVMRRQHSRSDNYHSSMESTSTHQLVPIDQQQTDLILWLDRGSNNQLICSSGSTTIHSGNVRVLHLDLIWSTSGSQQSTHLEVAYLSPWRGNVSTCQSSVEAGMCLKVWIRVGLPI